MQPSFCYSKIIVYHSFRHLHSQITKSPTEVGLFVMVPRFAAVAAGTHNRFTGAKGNWSISRQTNLFGGDYGKIAANTTENR